LKKIWTFKKTATHYMMGRAADNSWGHAGELRDQIVEVAPDRSLLVCRPTKQSSKNASKTGVAG
jgi:hypothetical protein